MEAAPSGIALAEINRESREAIESGDKKLLAIGSVNRTHHFALGPACERADVLTACQAYADHNRALIEQCGGGFEPPPDAETCPAYLAEACAGCVEYYECMIENTRCEPGGLTHYSGCSCPPPTSP